MSRNSTVTGPRRLGARLDPTAGGEFRALVWLLRHPLFAGSSPRWRSLAVRTWGRLAVGYGAGRAGGGAGGVVAGAPGLVRPVGRPRLRSARRRWTVYRGRRWAAAARRLRADPGEPPHRRRRCAPACCGSGR